mmetsp:Transcript_114643/g.331328  ORF Transcript_114643/g.331328 Transcript_114643/m.331328 type:complete len:530 (+) Transcript_114643:71-1660(+)
MTVGYLAVVACLIFRGLAQEPQPSIVYPDVESNEESCRSQARDNDGAALLQVPQSRRDSSLEQAEDHVNDREACAALKNEGTSFTIDVKVGSNAQTFSLVADTGSNSMIIPSCLCQTRGSCKPGGRCYSAKDDSSFKLYVHGKKKQAVAETLSFGSGDIAAIAAQDKVRISNLTTVMKDGILLMVDNALRFDTEKFEGILGLGPPLKKLAGKSQSTSMHLTEFPHEVKTIDIHGKKPECPSFLEQAGIDRFSMCFNDQAGGVLRFGGVAHEKPLPSIGQYHWGVGLEGISVGEGHATQKLKVCTADSMKDGQVTPCGMLPDSGTTLIMGPADQVAQLLESICDGWERCLKAHDNDGGDDFDPDSDLELPTKAQRAKDLLLDCDSWLNEGDGLGELPPIKFHIGHHGAGSQVLSLEAVNYVFKVGSGSCKAAFGPLSYETKQNGPVWIMGLPLFFGYHVTYDLKSDPPSVGFTSVQDSPCTPCAKKTAELVDTKLNADIFTSSAMRAKMQHSPREAFGPPRMPTFAYGEI